MKKGIFLFLTVLILFLTACKQVVVPDLESTVPIPSAFSLDTISVPRPFMQDTAKALVLLPKGYQEHPDSTFPVVYLLHGYSGDHTDWTTKAEGLSEWASLFGQIIVMPDGAYNSWYINSPLTKEQTFATHIGADVPKLIDSLYRTIPNARGRAITGLSMGGHGAMYLAANFPMQFGAVSSMSGGLDLRPFPNNWELQDILGDPVAEAKNWEDHSVIQLLEAFQERNTPILIDCGTEDFFLEVNEATHQKLNDLGIKHEYFIRPGAHNWDYWTKVLPYHLLFFDQYFNE